MFNNAGIAVGGYFEDLPFEKTRDMIDINLVGVLNGFHAAIPYLKRTEGALCISTSSSAAIYGAAGMATYTATKYAIKGFTHAMSVELSRFGVRVADVMPGLLIRLCGGRALQRRAAGWYLRKNSQAECGANG